MTTMARSFERGDVALALFPHSDLRTAAVGPHLMAEGREIRTLRAVRDEAFD